MTAQEIIAQVKDIPPAPEAAVKLLKLLNQHNQDNDEVVRVVQLDSALTAKLLRLCNSASYARASRIGSVEQAVMLLGHGEILRLVMSLGVGGALNRSLAGYAVDAKQLWEHSVTTAIAGQALVEYDARFDLDPALAFTAGLLHDIGKLALNQLLTDDMAIQIRELVGKQSLSRAEAENQVFGADHAAVGACLLDSWRLPQETVDAVANHHNPSNQPKRSLSAVLHIANCMAHVIGSAPGWDGFAVHTDENMIESIGIEPDTMERLIITVHEKISHAQKFLSI